MPFSSLHSHIFQQSAPPRAAVPQGCPCSAVSRSSCSPSDLLQHGASPSKSVSPAASPATSSSLCLLPFLLWFLQNAPLHISSCISLFVSSASSHLSFYVSYSPQLLPFLTDVRAAGPRAPQTEVLVHSGLFLSLAKSAGPGLIDTGSFLTSSRTWDPAAPDTQTLPVVPNSCLPGKKQGKSYRVFK